EGERDIDADAFFTGIMSTSLGEDEILVAVLVPVAKPGEGSAYVKFAHPASRYAVIGAAAHVSVANGRCTAARVAVGGLLPCARRAAAVEGALVGQAISEDRLTQAAQAITGDLGNDVTGDIFASAGYRAAVAPVYVRRALAAAAARAGRT
ncbi:MAG TPA: hypothetical protein VD833_14395, partial [Vicinamibacterales bacterium]|nr:hypothetical protein [Vicinamibacterales bacterium]